MLLVELSQIYFDKKGLARTIAGTITEERKRKYRILNNSLIALLAIAVLLKVLVVIDASLATGSAWMLLIILIAPLFNIFFLYSIARYHGLIYQPCGLLTIAGFLQSIGKADGTPDVIVNVVFTALVAGLSFYAGAKQFPRLHFLNKVEQDANGGYIL